MFHQLFCVPFFRCLMLCFASSATPAPPSLEQKILDSIAEVSAVTSAIVARFGHNSAAQLVAAIPTMAPVIAGFIDAIRGLFSHKAAASGS